MTGPLFVQVLSCEVVVDGAHRTLQRGDALPEGVDEATRDRLVRLRHVRTDRPVPPQLRDALPDDGYADAIHLVAKMNARAS
jgi:hypothetical protein